MCGPNREYFRKCAVAISQRLGELDLHVDVIAGAAAFARLELSSRLHDHELNPRIASDAPAFDDRRQ
jgi:hypothetical protein